MKFSLLHWGAWNERCSTYSLDYNSLYDSCLTLYYEWMKMVASAVYKIFIIHTYSRHKILK